MSGLYRNGEHKIRPGVYRRYENAGSNDVPGAIYGVFAVTVQANFGPLNTVKVFEKDQLEELKAMYGTGGTVDAALALFEGGASKVFVYRLGTGGTQASLEINASGSAKIATLKTKYPTADKFNITIKERLDDATLKQISVYRDTTLLETINYAKSENESAALIAAVNASSQYLVAEGTGAGTGAAAAITNQAMTGGAAPTVNTESYSSAFDAFESFTWNYLVLDTVDTAVHALVQAYIDRIYEEGALGAAIIGEPTTVAFETRLEHVKAYNDEKIIYLGSGYEDADGNKVDGYLAIAKQAGIIGSLGSVVSPTHTVIPGAVNTLESLKNSHYERAIQGGMLLLSPSTEGQVWFDAGINTLVTPGDNQDDGWKKIRRTATRFEVFDRINRAVTPLIGQVNCDNIGIGDVIMRGQAVLDAMVQEGKFYPESQTVTGPKFQEDPDFRRGPDYGHFVIDAVDMDSLEKIYLRYRFRFSAE